MLKSLAVTDDRRDRSGDVQHIADILPLVLAKYATHETQRISAVDHGPSHDAFPLRFDLSIGSSLSGAAGHF